MARTAPVLRARPACEGDVAYVDGPRVTLRKRLALAAFVGDGHTTTALGREGREAEDVAELRPHKVLASEAWIAAACDGRGPRWPGRSRPPLGPPPRAGRPRGEAALGRGGLARLSDDTARALATAGVTLDVRDAAPTSRAS